MTFYSIPGMSVHQNSDDSGSSRRGEPSVHGDSPGMVSQPVLNPATGEVLYHRKVYERSFTPGMDQGDGITYHGDRLEKVTDIHDRRDARTTTVYKRFSDDGKYRGEVAVQSEQTSEGGSSVVARSKPYKE